MAKKGRHRKGGRTTPKGTRPPGPRRPALEGSFLPDAPEPDLLDDVRDALTGNHPLALLELASSLLTVVDPREAVPFQPEDADPQPDRHELLDALAGDDGLEATALLAAVAGLATDQVERRRLERAVARRDHQLPAWLGGLARARASGVAQLTHVLGDSDVVLLGARLPTGEELAAVICIDHNVGTAVTDGLIRPGPIDDALRQLIEIDDDLDAAVTPLAPADAKVRVIDAIATGAITYPRFETETWPACRPLVEWMASRLPDGGQAYQRPEWSEADCEALTERFFASALGRSLDDADHRSLFDAILWFACDYGPGDPLRWSPAAVEILLNGWIPRKIAAGPRYLSKAPAVLRAFIRFCHAERAVPAHLTARTVKAVDAAEPDYQRTIRTPRPQGPEALLAAVGALDPDGPWELPADDEDGDDDGVED